MDTKVPRFYIDAVQFYNVMGMVDKIDRKIDDGVDGSDYYYFNYHKSKYISSNSNSVQQWCAVKFTDYRPVASVNYFGVLGQCINPTDSFTGGGLTIYQHEKGYIPSEDKFSKRTYNCDYDPVTVDSSDYFAFKPRKTGSMFVVAGMDEYKDRLPRTFFGHYDLITANNSGDLPETLAFRIGGYTDSFSDTDGGEKTLGGFTMGWTYTMPHSPDMSMTYSIEYDNYDTITTKGGATLTNTNWVNPYSMPFAPFHLWRQVKNSEGLDIPEGHSGRRVWSLKFSYLNRLDVFPTEQGSGISSESWNHAEGMYAYSDSVEGAILENRQVMGLKNDFYTRVIQGTRGGALPFIFQPDKDKEEFALCRFDQNSFRFTQQAPDLFEVSVKIVESW